MNQAPQFSTRRLLLLAAAIAGIIVVFLLSVDLQAVWEELRAARPLPLLLGGAALVAGLAAFALRWRLLLENKPGSMFTFHASNMGHAGNILLPFRAGEAIRVLVMGTEKDISLTESTSSFVVERLFEQMMRLLAVAGAVLIGVGLELSPTAVGSGLLFVVLGFGSLLWLANHPDFVQAKGTALLSRLPRMTTERATQVTTDFLDVLGNIANPRRFAQVMGWSLVTWGFFWAFFYAVLVALDTGLSFMDQLAVSLGALALSPPSAATQPGIFHASVVAPLAAVGFNGELLTAYAVLLHIVELLLISALGAWGLWATKVTMDDIRDLFRPKLPAP